MFNKVMNLIVFFVTTFTVFAVLQGSAKADENFRKRHPRRAEVNGREANQQRRIRQGLKNGTMTPDQAKQIEGQERAIKQQERADVRANKAMGKGATLTKQEQKQLNQELNQTSKEIYDDKHSAPPPPAAQ